MATPAAAPLSFDREAIQVKKKEYMLVQKLRLMGEHGAANAFIDSAGIAMRVRLELRKTLAAIETTTDFEEWATLNDHADMLRRLLYGDGY